MKQRKPVYEDKRKLARHGRLRLFVDMVAVIALAWFVVLMFGSSAEVTGKSMEPTAQNEDELLIDQFRYHFTEPDILDPIAFSMPDYPGKIYVKRIVALPGERVQIKDGRLFINGEERKLPDSMKEIAVAGAAAEELTLGKDEYFVLGDNPGTSEDSRFSDFGFVKKDQILGRLWLRISPFTRMGLIR